MGIAIVGGVTRQAVALACTAHTIGGQRRIASMEAAPAASASSRGRDAARYGCHATSDAAFAVPGSPPWLSHDRSFAIRGGGGSLPFNRKPLKISGCGVRTAYF